MENTPFHIAITKEQLSKLPPVEFAGAITVVSEPEDVAAAVEFLRSQDVVGFDTETKPNFKKGMTNKVSLIQVSTEDHSYLFRLNKIGFTPELKEFMECDDVVKVGLSLKDDFHVLHRIAEFEPRNFIDLQEVVKRFSISDLSLQKIYAILFGHRISKSQRLTNWEASTLTPSQMVYASIDAWACLRIYRLLHSRTFIPEESPYKIIATEAPEQA
ncbi:3'-5' exonuclease [uncultured Duncaniella sp.]|uniref:3'-5' exonuclease n=1 Tax=uncultured Duncaniella sp. TaxID=2768039 RepID=UPI0025ADA319|nr:3'-5' exonuclease [uncultured Duncaniella sp.]